MLTLSDPGKQALDGGEVLASIRGHLSSAGQEHNSRNNPRGYFDASPLAELGIAETAGARLQRVVGEWARGPACLRIRELEHFLRRQRRAARAQQCAPDRQRLNTGRESQGESIPRRQIGHGPIRGSCPWTTTTGPSVTVVSVSVIVRIISPPRTRPTKRAGCRMPRSIG